MAKISVAELKALQLALSKELSNSTNPDNNRIGRGSRTYTESGVTLDLSQYRFQWSGNTSGEGSSKTVPPEIYTVNGTKQVKPNTSQETTNTAKSIITVDRGKTFIDPLTAISDTTGLLKVNDGDPIPDEWFDTSSSVYVGDIISNLVSYSNNKTLGADQGPTSSGCKGACLGLCQGTCTGDASVACSSSSCSGGCGAACTKGCGNGCSGGCGGCSGGCTDSCSASCGEECHGGVRQSSECEDGSCTGTCNLGCNGCRSSCTVGCRGNSCTGGCYGGCGDGCSGGCGGCSATCGSVCRNACSSGCGTACGGTCVNSCGEDCTNSCVATCSNTNTGLINWN